ncbi:hypothetical protein D9V34_17315 [Mycetocola lacteus]|uniref:Uncharacterized protein n=1 Tax=Mycetocola lacteus TaxID=76637 RepID=A0A3L7AF19_9MICO|nr:hypothetical protein [Mycetocola lacteus]RLP78574.1 hypothetical protein D9V34_17315 [Mycetocola lacteus]
MSHESFSGETPYAICEQYAAGKIDRAQLVDELTRWEYAPPARTKDYFDDLLFDAPGSTDDLERARRRGLIDEDTFYEIADRLEALHEVDPEKRWPELFEPLPDDARSEAIAACWRVQTDAGSPLSHRDAQHIISLIVDDPERFAMLYGPYVPVDEADYAKGGKQPVKPGTTVLRGTAAVAEVRRLLAETDNAAQGPA